MPRKPSAASASPTASTGGASSKNAGGGGKMKGASTAAAAATATPAASPASPQQPPPLPPTPAPTPARRKNVQTPLLPPTPTTPTTTAAAAAEATTPGDGVDAVGKKPAGRRGGGRTRSSSTDDPPVTPAATSGPDGSTPGPASAAVAAAAATGTATTTTTAAAEPVSAAADPTVLLDYMWHSSQPTKTRTIGGPTRSRKEKVPLEEQVRMAVEMNTALGEEDLLGALPAPAPDAALSTTTTAAAAAVTPVPAAATGGGKKTNRTQQAKEEEEQLVRKILYEAKAEYAQGKAILMQRAVTSSSEDDTESAARRRRPAPAPGGAESSAAAGGNDVLPPPAKRMCTSGTSGTEAAAATGSTSGGATTTTTTALPPPFLSARAPTERPVGYESSLPSVATTGGEEDGGGHGPNKRRRWLREVLSERGGDPADVIHQSTVDVSLLPPPIAPSALLASSSAATAAAAVSHDGPCTGGDDAATSPCSGCVSALENAGDPQRQPSPGALLVKRTLSNQVHPRDYGLYTDRKFKDMRFEADLLNERQLIQALLCDERFWRRSPSCALSDASEKEKARRAELCAKGYGEASVAMESFDFATHHTHGKSAWPTSTNLRCRYDHHRFAGVPILIPLRYYEPQGILTVLTPYLFCSFSCAKAWLEREAPRDLCIDRRLRMLDYVAKRFFGVTDPIQAAPEIIMHEDYGGRLTTAQFRALCTTHASFLEYPLSVSVPSTMVTEVLIYAKTTRDERAAMRTRVFDEHTQRQPERPEKGHVDASEPNARRLKEGMGRPLKHRCLADDHGRMVTLDKPYLDKLISEGKRKRDADTSVANTILAHTVQRQTAPSTSSSSSAATATAAAPSPMAPTGAPATLTASSAGASAAVPPSGGARPLLAGRVVERFPPTAATTR